MVVKSFKIAQHIFVSIYFKKLMFLMENMWIITFVRNKTLILSEILEFSIKKNIVPPPLQRGDDFWTLCPQVGREHFWKSTGGEKPRRGKRNFHNPGGGKSLFKWYICPFIFSLLFSSKAPYNRKQGGFSGRYRDPQWGWNRFWNTQWVRL